MNFILETVEAVADALPTGTLMSMMFQCLTGEAWCTLLFTIGELTVGLTQPRSQQLWSLTMEVEEVFSGVEYWDQVVSR